MYQQRTEEGQYSQFYLPFSKYKIIWSITHLKMLLCNNTLNLAKGIFIRMDTLRITLSFPRVHICHMSKAPAVAEYFTQLSGE